MPQPSQSLPTVETRLARSLTISSDLKGRRNKPGDDPVAILLDDPARQAALSRRGLIAESASELPFHRLRIVLASLPRESVFADGDTPSGVAGTGPMVASCPAGAVPQRVEIWTDAPAIEQAPDPVIDCLSDALAAAERASDQHSRIYADAVRLAIAIRLLGQPPQCAHRSGELVEPALAARQVRALQKWRLKRVLEYIDDHLSRKITLGDLAAVAGLSRMHFASQFRAATGLRPHEYLLRQRIGRAEELLLGSAMTIVEIALTVGFQTQAHFTTVFKRFVGHTPCQWRNARHADGLAST